MDRTSFQQNVVSLLESTLRKRDFVWRIEEVPESEVGPIVILRSNGAEGYIYQDWAGWFLGEHWQPFEREDFDSPSELIDAFCGEFANVVRTGRLPERSAGTAALYPGLWVKNVIRSLFTRKPSSKTE